MEPAPEHDETVEEWLVIPPKPGSWEAFGLLSERRVRIWALVLEARGVPFRVEQHGMGWRLLVPQQSFAAAGEELRLFEEENRDWPPAPPQARPLANNVLVNLSVLILVAIFHNLTLLDLSRFGLPHPDWMALGAAHVEMIHAGQWWRLVTPLTLHADAFHLAGNLTLGGLLIVWLCRELGSGLGWSLLLGAGILGNLANAAMQSASHRSVGASTLVFGAVGIFAALSAVRYRRHLQQRWGVPLAAAMALLALLGTEGLHTDLGAHLWGVVCGIGLGLPAEYLLERHGPPGPWVNRLLAVSCAALVVSAWWWALTAG